MASRNRSGLRAINSRTLEGPRLGPREHGNRGMVAVAIRQDSRRYAPLSRPPFSGEKGRVVMVGPSRMAVQTVVHGAPNLERAHVKHGVGIRLGGGESRTEANNRGGG